MYTNCWGQSRRLTADFFPFFGEHFGLCACARQKYPLIPFARRGEFQPWQRRHDCVQKPPGVQLILCLKSAASFVSLGCFIYICFIHKGNLICCMCFKRENLIRRTKALNYKHKRKKNLEPGFQNTFADFTSVGSFFHSCAVAKWCFTVFSEATPGSCIWPEWTDFRVPLHSCSVSITVSFPGPASSAVFFIFVPRFVNLHFKEKEEKNKNRIANADFKWVLWHISLYQQ